jgi:NAD(P)-dependent dehydrogenase (short-subunit alcohol dehydrogenase family)
MLSQVRMLRELTLHLSHQLWLIADACRAKLQQEGYPDVKSVRLDVTDLSTIVAAKEVVQNEDGKLDVLVNNAGKHPP